MAVLDFRFRSLTCYSFGVCVWGGGGLCVRESEGGWRGGESDPLSRHVPPCAPAGAWNPFAEELVRV